jgi:hypothetical protein
MADNKNEITAEEFRARFPQLVEIGNRTMNAKSPEEAGKLFEEHRQAVKALSPEDRAFLKSL